MMHEFFYQLPVFVQYLIVSLLVLWVIAKLKALLIVSSCSFSREIEAAQGEMSHFNINFYAFEPQSVRIRKYYRHVEIAEDRKQFCHDRFQATLREQERIQQEEAERRQHLKKV